MSGDDPSKNPFIRWRQHVDANIAATLQGFVGLPSAVSRNHNTRWNDRPAEAAQNSTGDEPAVDAGWTEWRQAAEWTTFVFDSPYSPLALRSLPQPVPRDIPGHVEHDAFTFEDAFEDLLTVASGGKMMDLDACYQIKKVLRQMFPSGEPVFFWLQRLRSQGLLDAYFPRHPVSFESPVDRWQQHWERAAALESRQRASESQTPIQDSEGEVSDQTRQSPSPFSDLDRLVKVAGKILGDLELPDQSHRGKGESSEGQGKAAETFDELYSAVNSAFSESGKSLTALFKLVSEAGWERQAGFSGSKDSPLEPGSTKSERVETSEDHVDEFGYLHTKRVVRTLNERGEEIGCETEYSVRPAEPADRTRAGGVGQNADQSHRPGEPGPESGPK